MRPQTHQLKTGLVRLAVDQHEVGPDMAIAVITPLTRQRVIERTPGQSLIRRQDIDDFHKQAIQPLAVLPRFLAPVVAFKSP
jgi:hypothetical protein